MFRFITVPQVSAALSLTPEAEPEALALQEVVQAQAIPWVRLWTPDLPEFQPLRRLPVHVRTLPGPLPSPAQFRDLLNIYRSNTAVGADHWQPRTIMLLPDRLIERLLALWRIFILTFMFPDQINLLQIVLIPETDGGGRPIGVFPTVLRALDR